MFFDVILLSRQHRARFGCVWIAGTRGVQHVSKKQILEIDIEKLCEEIKHYLCSESESPRARFSLRLSVILINGSLKIYRQKAVYLMDDVTKALTWVSRPLQTGFTSGLDPSGFFATPPSPIIKKRGKKRQQPDTEKSTPQSEIDKLIDGIRAIESIDNLVPHTEQAVLQARADEVTLHEIQVPREEQEGFGSIQVDEDFLRDIVEADASRSIAPQPLQPIEEVPTPLTLPTEPTSERPRQRSSASSSSIDEAPVRITVQAQVHAEASEHERQAVSEFTAEAAPEEIQHVQIAPAEPEVPIEIEQPPSVLREIQVDVAKERDENLVLKRKRDDKDLSKHFISNTHTRVIRINRGEPDENEWININPCPLPRFKLKTPNLTALLNTYLIQDDDYIQRRQKTSEVPSLEDSARVQRKSRVSTPPVQISEERSSLVQQIPNIRLSAPEEESPMVETCEIQIGSGLEIEQPLIASTPTTSRRSNIEPRTIEEIMPPAAQRRTTLTPRRLIDMESQVSKDIDFITLPTDLHSRDITSMQEELDSVSLFLLTDQNRQQHIVNKIFTIGRMTLQEVCQKPVNRINISRAFQDVLVLAKHSYVMLKTEDDSCQLAFIEKGPKMLC